jgi:hypothetical protein
MTEASQSAHTLSMRNDYRYGTQSKRNEDFISPERLLAKRKGHTAAVSTCIDLTAYEYVKDERETSFVSTISDMKIDERSSNCENEAAVAVNNIKTLLDLGDYDDTAGQDINHVSRNDETATGRHQTRDVANDDYASEHAAGNQTGPIRIWTSEEPPRPEHLQQPKSEYHKAKERLLWARRNNKNNSLGKATTNATNVERLTKKHEELIQKSSELRSSNKNDHSPALREIIHIENDQITLPGSPKSPKSIGSVGNRLFIDTSEMEKKFDEHSPLARRQGRLDDLVSAFAYEFKKHDNDEQSDIIVVDDIFMAQSNHMPEQRSNSRNLSIAGQNVAARYEAIRNSVTGRLNLEKTRSHPLASPIFRVPDGTTNSKIQCDLSPSKIHFIRDQVTSLQQPQDEEHVTDISAKIPQPSFLDDVQDVTVGVKATDEIQGTQHPEPVRSPSRASAIEGQILVTDIVPQTSKSLTNEEDDPIIPPLTAEAEYRKKIKGNIAAITKLRPSCIVDGENQDIAKAESDFITITRNLSSNLKHQATDKSEDIDGRQENLTLTTQPIEETILNTKDGSVDSCLNMFEDSGLTIPQAIIQNESTAVIDAAELCVGFCSNSGDTTSIPDVGKGIMAKSNLQPLATKSLASIEIGGTQFQEKKVNPPQSISPVLVIENGEIIEDAPEARVISAHSRKLNARYNDERKIDDDRHNESIYNNNLALSADDSSSSYPSDVDIDDDDHKALNDIPNYDNGCSVFIHSNTNNAKNVPSNQTIASSTNSAIREVSVSVSDNASYVSDNSGTMASQSTDSDLDEDTGIYDACFARQILDDTCAWLERDETSFCFKPSLLKKVSKRNIGPMKQYYARSPLMLRVPRNQILTRNYLQSRRKINELPPQRSKKSSKRGNAQNFNRKSTVLHVKENQNEVAIKELNVSPNKNNNNIVSNDDEVIHDFITPINSNVSKTTEATLDEITNINTKEVSTTDTASGVFEVNSKNLAIFEVKSAEEYTSRHFIAYQQLLRSRSMSPRSFQSKTSNKSATQYKIHAEGNDIATVSDLRQEISLLNKKIVESECSEKINSSTMQNGIDSSLEDSNYINMEPIDCTGEIFDSHRPYSSNQAMTASEEAEYSSRPKSRREGLAKLRQQKPIRNELIECDHDEFEVESTSNVSMLTEDQRLAALDLAEKLRRRATTLRRRRKIRERRKELP